MHGRLGISLAELARKKSDGSVVKSANETFMARLKGNSYKLVFGKNTKPQVAQLEVVAADFYRQMMGDCSSHGKLIVENGEIKGSYGEAIPGFISMAEVAAFARGKDVLKKRIGKIEADIAKIEKELGITTDPAIKEERKAMLKENQAALGSCKALQELGLIDEEKGTIELKKVATLLPKALCTAFFFEDWDRHKNNFGFSFVNGKLDIASLDYDKSLSGSSHTKNYNWDITPQRLRDFPVFKCWFWPTGSSSPSAILHDAESDARVYTSDEKQRYASLKDDPGFKRQAMKEWLKLAFIPTELRERAVSSLAGNGCDPTLKNVPKVLEEKRQKLIFSLVQLNSFREEFNDDKKRVALLKEVKEELESNLSEAERTEFNMHWGLIERDLVGKIAGIKRLEAFAKDAGCHKLLEAIERTGISFSASANESTLDGALKKIENVSSSKEIARTLNAELGLDISEADAQQIKREMYLQRVCKELPPDLSAVVASKGATGEIKIKKISFPPKDITLRELGNFEAAVKRCRGKTGDDLNASFDKVVKSLRSLGVNETVLSDDKLKKWKSDISSPPVWEKNLGKVCEKMPAPLRAKIEAAMKEGKIDKVALKDISNFEAAVTACKGSRQARAGLLDENFERVVGELNKLGIDKTIISDEDLKKWKGTISLPEVPVSKVAVATPKF